MYKIATSEMNNSNPSKINTGENAITQLYCNPNSFKIANNPETQIAIVHKINFITTPPHTIV